MRLIRKNVEREADGVTAQKLMNDGFKPVETAPLKTASESAKEATKNIEEMTVEELKTLAKKRGLTGVSDLVKQDLIDILKG